MLSAVSAVLALFPFVFLFFIIQEIIEVSPNLAEATVSLDAENETEIQQAISRLVEQKTVLIIAHRVRSELFSSSRAW